MRIFKDFFNKKQSKNFSDKNSSIFTSPIASNKQINSSTIVGVFSNSSFSSNGQSIRKPQYPAYVAQPINEFPKNQVLTEKQKQLILSQDFKFRQKISNFRECYEKSGLQLYIQEQIVSDGFRTLAILCFPDSLQAGTIYWQLEGDYVLNAASIEFELTEELFINIMKRI